jgi:hypothetical protein
LMQNPRARFDAQRPRLPGQEHPGTGLGRQVHSLLVLLCRRLGRDALLTVPERFHLAVLYRRVEYVPIDAHDDVGLVAALQAGQEAGVSMAALAWAVERACVLRPDGSPWSYRPAALVCPVSPRLERALSQGALDDAAPPPLRLTVDVASLESSLARSPVPGLHTIWR